MRKNENRIKHLLSMEQLQSLLDICRISDFKMFVVLLLIYYGTLRVNEITSIRQVDLTAEGICIRRKKHISYGLVHYPVFVMEQVRKLSESNSNDSLFNMSNRTLELKIQLLGNRIGVRHLTITDIRSSIATQLNNSGLSLLEISGIMGHRSSTVTENHYIKGAVSKVSNVEILQLK